MRRGNVIRLPAPPVESAQDVKTLYQHIATVTDLLNQSLQSVQNRLNTIQQTGAKAPPAVQNLAVQGKQGCFYLTWWRIQNADGYTIMQYQGANTNVVIGRYTTTDADTCSYTIPVGNVAVQCTFRVSAYQGPYVGLPSTAITATTAVYSSPEAAPPAPPKAPREVKLAPPRSGPNLP